MTLEGIAQKIIRKMKAEGKVIVVSQETTYKIDREIGECAAKAKEEFERKERASRYHIALVESGAINYFSKR